MDVSSKLHGRPYNGALKGFLIKNEWENNYFHFKSLLFLIVVFLKKLKNFFLIQKQHGGKKHFLNSISILFIVLKQ